MNDWLPWLSNTSPLPALAVQQLFHAVGWLALLSWASVSFVPVQDRRWRWLGPMLPPGIRPRRPGPPCMRLRRPILKANRTAPAGQRGCSGASTRPIQQLDSQRMSCGLRAWNQDYAALRLLYQRKAVASDSEWPMRDRKATRRRLPTRTGSCR